MIPDRAANQYNYFRNNGMLFQTPQAGDLFFWKNTKDGSYHTGMVFDIPEDGKIGIIDAPGEGRKVDYRAVRINDPSYIILGYGRIIQ